MTHPTLNQITFCKIKISAHVLFKYLEVWFRNGKKRRFKDQNGSTMLFDDLFTVLSDRDVPCFSHFLLMSASLVALIYFCPGRMSNNPATAQCVIRQSAVKSNLLTGLISKGYLQVLLQNVHPLTQWKYVHKLIIISSVIQCKDPVLLPIYGIWCSSLGCIAL